MGAGRRSYPKWNVTTLIATSVVRGSQQGDSHGGVYLVDFASKEVNRTIDWNSGDIDFRGRGWDRGLRGIAFDGDDIYIAASDELFVYDPSFRCKVSYRNRYLKHAHEIHRHRRKLYVTSTGFNSILIFDLDCKAFSEGLTLQLQGNAFSMKRFDPSRPGGPLFRNLHHINSVWCDDGGLYLSGRGLKALLCYREGGLVPVCTLPADAHNAQPYRNGVLFNDTGSNAVRFAAMDVEIAFPVPAFPEDQLTHSDLDASATARQAFGRGLCVIGDGVIAAGSSPSTITLYDIDRRIAVSRVTLTPDVRNAIHGLEVWPF
jgi:hypothetical protein